MSTPGGVQRGGAWKIAVVSAAVLILELAFIRQVPAEVRAISYFTNLLLMAAFFGLGLGCILQERRPLRWLLPLGLLCMLGFVLVARGLVVYEEAAEVHYWLQHADPAGTAPRVPMFPAALMAFVFGAMPFVALGQTLAVTMDRHPRLVAYAWDIAGSLAGTIVFSLSSWLDLPPWIWPPVVVVAWAALFVPSRPGRVAALLAGFAFLLFSQTSLDWHWSPYYFIQHEQGRFGLRVYVNSSFHQQALDLADDAPEARRMQAHMLRKFSIPYDVYRDYHDGPGPGRVLILGAGTGNDANVALRNGAREVVAVEIDPVILELGKLHNTARPYDDPRVATVVDDARHYLKTADREFDMIVLGTLDSQTLLSGNVNLRLENYVYTREAFEDARSLLADRGVLAAYYSVFEDRSPWLFGRLYATVRAAFGDQVRIQILDSGFLFNTIVMAAKGIPRFGDVADDSGRAEGGMPSTDDWPFLYMERPTISPLYLKLFVAIGVLILGVFLLLRRIHPVRGLHANFLFLGVGFTLMESAAIVRLALVFGSTWTVNAVVFAAVLATIFLANLLVLRDKAPSLRLAWAGLAASILLNVFFPLTWLFVLPAPLKVGASGVLIGLPVFFAALCFSHLFKHQKTTGYALGINLVGAMAGGLVEYLSMLIGMRAVWLVVLGVYTAAWLTTRLAARSTTPHPRPLP